MVNLVLVWLVIHIVFYRVLGLGFNFLSQVNLETLVATGPWWGGRQGPDPEALINPAARIGERAVVNFVLIGFFFLSFVTILFRKWPIRPSDLTQPQAGLAELGWCTMLTLFFYTALIVPFWGVVYGKVFGSSLALNFRLVERPQRHRPRALGLRLVGVGHHRLVHDPERLADEALVGHRAAPALERAALLRRHYRPGLSLGPGLCEPRPFLVAHAGGHRASAATDLGSPIRFCGIMRPKSPASLSSPSSSGIITWMILRRKRTRIPGEPSGSGLAGYWGWPY